MGHAAKKAVCGRALAVATDEHAIGPQVGGTHQVGPRRHVVGDDSDQRISGAGRQALRELLQFLFGLGVQ